MHLLPCPQCQTPIAVAPSQAGGRTSCPSCDSEVAIPTLGQLKRLPIAESVESSPPMSETTASGGPTAKRVGFVLLAMIATATLLIAGFATIRWSLIETPMTSESHIRQIREVYKTLTPAELIREYEQMEKYALDMVIPYHYQTVAAEKRRWGWTASISGAIAGIAVIGAIALAASGRGNHPPAADT